MNLNMSFAKGVSRRLAAVAALVALAVPAAAAPGFWDLSLSSSARHSMADDAVRTRNVGFARVMMSGFSQEPRAGVRAAMVRAVAFLRPGGTQIFLTQALQDASPRVRQAAAAALGEKGAAAAVSALASMLSSEPDSGVRMTIAFWLGFGPKPGGSASVSALSRILTSDRDPNVRLQAAQSLSRIGGSAARSALKKARHDADPRVRRAAGGS